MTNHIHLIISSDRIELNEIVRDFKKFTSRQLVDTIQGTHESRRKWLLSKFSFEAKRIGRATNYKVWQDGFHPIILNTNRKLQNRVEYIHYNPIHAGFVNHERDWANSSYLAYEEEKPMLNFKVEPLY